MKWLALLFLAGLAYSFQTEISGLPQTLYGGESYSATISFIADTLGKYSIYFQTSMAPEDAMVSVGGKTCPYIGGQFVCSGDAMAGNNAVQLDIAITKGVYKEDGEFSYWIEMLPPSVGPTPAPPVVVPNNTITPTPVKPQPAPEPNPTPVIPKPAPIQNITIVYPNVTGTNITGTPEFNPNKIDIKISATSAALLTSVIIILSALYVVY